MNMRKMFMILVLSVFLVPGYPTATVAETIYVSGDVSGTWTADTVIVTGDIRVPSGLTLNIQPGVEVFFSVYAKFIVDSTATLRAIGTVSDSIRFNESWDWPNNGWHGIRFLSASNSSRLEFCNLRNGFAWGSGGDENGGAIYCSNSSPTILNCLIDSSEATGSGGGIYCNSTSHPYIINNTFDGNIAWDYGGGIYCASYSYPQISINTIIGNTAWDYGGGIYCGTYSYPTISSNTLEGNSGLDFGGGIYCGSNSSPTISENNITANTAEEYGGGIYCGSASYPGISSNYISLNDANYGGGVYCGSSSHPYFSDNVFEINSAGYGGGLYCSTYSYPTISNNSIVGNTAIDGGGIYCVDFTSPSLVDNTIKNNAATDGAGIYLYSSAPSLMEFNEISLNSALDSGGGIYLIYSSPNLNKNTIAGDTALVGGGIYSVSSNPVLHNCIVWGNVPQQIYQIYGSVVQATYSDIDSYPVWSGVGNINDDPLFVSASQGDYHLQWNSPCIDAGDPSSPLDPDGTITDMGRYYFDQSVSDFVVELTYNYGSPIPAGGSFINFDVFLENTGSSTQNFDLWIEIPPQVTPPAVPNRNLTFPGGFSITRPDMDWPIPGSWPAGAYWMTWNIGILSTLEVWATDSFPFVKSADDDGSGFTLWEVEGDPLDQLFEGIDLGESAVVSEFALLGSYPNPFNPTTTIGFSLPEDALVELTIYNQLGKSVSELVNGYRKAGLHEVTFDGSGLSSGMYLYTLKAGELVASGKMVLMK